MLTRRAFVATIGAASLAGLKQPLFAAEAQEIKTVLNGTIGLQLWSLRTYLKKDLSGTLAKIRQMGFQDVETAGFYDKTPVKFRGMLDQAGLKCQSCHTGYSLLRERPASVCDEVRALGATWVVCPWIDHGQTFTPADARAAVGVFNTAGKVAKDSGLKLAYHCHGYEFMPSTEGTLFDTIVGSTDPELVSFQIDVQHAYLGGGDPAAIITRYADRVKSLHLKDLAKGTTIVAGTAIAPADADVPVGTGAIDMPSVLRAAVKAGVSLYYIEDESPDPMGHIPQSLAYLERLTL
jgi:sugar phosphate isomerase/epimerase